MSEFYEYDKALSKINDLEHENFLLQARIAELEAQQRWIPVGERLPEDWTMVLFTNGVTRGIGQFDKDGFYDYWYEYSFNKPVTHWMPLPEAPKERAE